MTINQYRFTHEKLGPMVHHPFYIGFDHDQLVPLPEWLQPIEYIIETKMRRAQRAIEESRWDTYVWLHERPYRTEALYKIWRQQKLSDAVVGPLCREVWTDCENIPQVLEMWREFYGEIPAECWMSTEDMETWTGLPNTLELYRGVCDDGDISWTLSRDIAKFFANRGINGATGEIVAVTVPKAETWAYFGSRGESEIIMFPEGWIV